jgi:hypothetical protein
MAGRLQQQRPLLSDNFGYNPCMTYQEAGETHELQLKGECTTAAREVPAG